MRHGKTQSLTYANVEIIELNGPWFPFLDSELQQMTRSYSNYIPIIQLSNYPSYLPAISQLYPYKSPFLLVFCCPPALWSGCRSPSWHFQAPSLSVDAANLPRDCQGIAVQRRGQVGVGSFSASHGPNGSCGSCGSWLVNGFSSPIYNP